jgi:putative endonuclease
MNEFLYYLYSEKLGKHYIGKTDNLERRFKEHSNGEEKFTKTGVPWKLVGYIQGTRAEIDSLEYKLKKAKNPKYVRWYIKKYGIILE